MDILPCQRPPAEGDEKYSCCHYQVVKKDEDPKGF